MITRLLVIASILASASLALAQGGTTATVAVLGLRSIEGDDEVSNALTEHLRGAVPTVEGWDASGTSVSMTQMSLAYGCDELDASCLADVAKGLQVDRIIYGTLSRTAAGADYDYAVRLNLFDAARGEIVTEVDDVLPQAGTTDADLAPRAASLVKRLSGLPQGGTIVIEANVNGADVVINGQSVGSADDGTLRLEDLQPGQYRIEVSKPGYTTHVSTVTLDEGTEAAISAALEDRSIFTSDTTTADAGGHHLGTLGWVLVGVGGAALVGAGVSMFMIEDIDGDPLLEDYRDRVAAGNEIARMEGSPVYGDVCAAADDGLPYGLSNDDVGEVADLCAKADTLEVLQWVFLGTALAAGGTGVALILTEADDPEPESAAGGGASRPALSLVPRLGRDSAHVSATLRF
ncbi:MAG: PEGA domain-containing protein [Myxococcales bacterium]|jgi:hypothetical protein